MCIEHSLAVFATISHDYYYYYYYLAVVVEWQHLPGHCIFQERMTHLVYERIF